MKEFKEKGYYTMDDGSKSSDIHPPGGKKKIERSAAKETGKRKSVMEKDSKVGKKAATAKKPVTTKKSQQSDELDIESEESSVVQDSD
jgi:hypothetical protein